MVVSLSYSRQYAWDQAPIVASSHHESRRQPQLRPNVRLGVGPLARAGPHTKTPSPRLQSPVSEGPRAVMPPMRRSTATRHNHRRTARAISAACCYICSAAARCTRRALAPPRRAARRGWASLPTGHNSDGRAGVRVPEPEGSRCVPESRPASNKVLAGGIGVHCIGDHTAHAGQMEMKQECG